MKTRATEETYKFDGIVKDIDPSGASATVIINEEDELRKSAGDIIIVDLGESDTELSIGDKITVEYDGRIMESSPPQVNAIGIKVNDKGTNQSEEALIDPLPDDRSIICGYVDLNESPNTKSEPY